MSKPMTPELKKFMDKRISVKLNAHRLVMGRLRGFDHFMNMVLDEAIEEVSATEKREIGLIVSACTPTRNRLHKGTDATEGCEVLARVNLESVRDSSVCDVRRPFSVGVLALLQAAKASRLSSSCACSPLSYRI